MSPPPKLPARLTRAADIVRAMFERREPLSAIDRVLRARGHFGMSDLTVICYLAFDLHAIDATIAAHQLDRSALQPSPAFDEEFRAWLKTRSRPAQGDAVTVVDTPAQEP